MQIQYIGNYSEVMVPLPLGGFAYVKRGEMLQTSADHAQQLLLQAINWTLPEVVEKAVAKKTKTKTNTEATSKGD